MKDWLRIGKFAEATGLSTKALRLYEKRGLIESHTRGENGYRYYSASQIKTAEQIKELKEIGFTLKEISQIQGIDQSYNSDRFVELLEDRLQSLKQMAENVSEQRSQVSKILTSLKSKRTKLKNNERRYLMGRFKNVVIAVTGKKDLNSTAETIARLIEGQDSNVEKVKITDFKKFDRTRPQIVLVPEANLSRPEVRGIKPDVIVVRDLEKFDAKTEENYLNLYSNPGAHMITVFNADDGLSVKLAANSVVRKGRTFYYSKNKGLEEQIQNIGGVVSNGKEVSIYGFNLKEKVEFEINQTLGFDHEQRLMASLGAVMDIGMDKEQLSID